jgi:hypothetical protein
LQDAIGQVVRCAQDCVVRSGVAQVDVVYLTGGSSALQPLVAGQQVFDSYGKKCNSRFLLNYGFTVEHNADDDTGQFHNELRLSLTLPSPAQDPWHWHKAERLGGSM